MQSGFRTIVTLKAPYLERDGAKHQLSPGMQVSSILKRYWGKRA